MEANIHFAVFFMRTDNHFIYTFVPVIFPVFCAD